MRTNKEFRQIQATSLGKEPEMNAFFLVTSDPVSFERVECSQGEIEQRVKVAREKGPSYFVKADDLCPNHLWGMSDDNLTYEEANSQGLLYVTDGDKFAESDGLLYY